MWFNCTVKSPRFTDTCLIRRTAHYYGQLTSSLGKESPLIFSKCNQLKPSFDKLIFSDAGKHVRKYDDGFCDGKLDGNYKDPDTCYGYIACSNEIAYKMPCPTGLMYNEEKDQCDYPGNVDCGKAPVKSKLTVRYESRFSTRFAILDSCANRESRIESRIESRMTENKHSCT